MNSGHVESTGAPCPGHAPSASTHSTHPVAAVHTLDLGRHARPPRPAAPAQRRPTRPMGTAIRWTRVATHPMSPSGLITTGRAPFLLLLKPAYMVAATCAVLTWPGVSFPSRSWPVSSCLGAGPYRSPDLKALPPQYAGERGGSPLSPTPPIPVLPHPTFNSIGRSPDRTLDLWPVKLATEPAGNPHDALPVADHALATAWSYLTTTGLSEPIDRLPSPSADDAILNKRRQNQPSQPHPDTPLTAGSRGTWPQPVLRH